MELDLTKEDVLGERYQFIPVVEDLQLVKVDEFGNKIPVEMPHAEEKVEKTEEKVDTEVDESVVASIPVIEQAPIEVVDEVEEPEQNVEIPEPANVTVDETPSGEVLDIEEDDLNLSDSEPDFVDSDMIVEDDYQQDLSQQPSLDDLQEPVDLTLDANEPDIESSIVEPVGNLLDDEPPLEEDDLDSILSEEPQPEDDFVTEPSVGEQGSQQGYPAYSEDALTEDDLNFLEENQSNVPEEPFNVDKAVDSIFDDDEEFEQPIENEPPVVPVYPAEENTNSGEDFEYKQGDRVTHHRYGRGVVEKIIKYGNKTLCSISFENVGRRLLDPTITDLKKLSF